MTMLELLLTTLAFALFGLASYEHSRKRLGRPVAPAAARRMRTTAWIALAAAFPPAIAMHGWVFGPIQWAGSVMAGAGIVFLGLNFLPGRKSP